MIRAIYDSDEGYVAAKEALTKEVAFTGLDYGYYVIDKELEGMTEAQKANVAVTITSNTPTVNVIDKNQKPASEFFKQVWNEETNQWDTSNSAQIGDIVDFKVEFTATNYDGDQQIKYYSVKDTKGGALWVEFDSITVKVNGVKLEKGFYHCANPTPGFDTDEWDYLGEDENGNSYWSDAEKNQENSEDLADWYLIHYGYDEFDIVIPWMTNHNFTGTTNGFTLTYGENSISDNPSPATVTIEYSASVEPNASIGNPQDNNLWNTATLTWIPSSPITPPGSGSSTTGTSVYALGLHKVDEDSNESLADAEFEIFRVVNGVEEPVYVIPTNIKGVYILDDLYTVVSGENRDTSRETYEAYLEDYLGPNYATTQKNILTTEANGKVVVLGLEAGDYYLRETKAPDGYNILGEPVKVTIAGGGTFFVVADANGNVVDADDAADGYIKHNYTATPTTITNGKGVELPSTGGAGTMMLITIGTMIAMAFAVLLITHKKMSIYHD